MHDVLEMSRSVYKKRVVTTISGKQHQLSPSQ
jgi:hypothetical protein